MPNPVKKGMDAQVEMNKFTVAREVLHNNYQLCSPYHFCMGNKPKKFDFVHHTVFARRCTWAGHKTIAYTIGPNRLYLQTWSANILSIQSQEPKSTLMAKLVTKYAIY